MFMETMQPCEKILQQKTIGRTEKNNLKNNDVMKFRR